MEKAKKAGDDERYQKETLDVAGNLIGVAAGGGGKLLFKAARGGAKKFAPVITEKIGKKALTKGGINTGKKILNPKDPPTKDITGDIKPQQVV